MRGLELARVRVVWSQLYYKMYMYVSIRTFPYNISQNLIGYGVFTKSLRFGGYLRDVRLSSTLFNKQGFELYGVNCITKCTCT